MKNLFLGLLLFLAADLALGQASSPCYWGSDAPITTVTFPIDNAGHAAPGGTPGVLFEAGSGTSAGINFDGTTYSVGDVIYVDNPVAGTQIIIGFVGASSPIGYLNGPGIAKLLITNPTDPNTGATYTLTAGPFPGHGSYVLCFPAQGIYLTNSRTIRLGTNNDSNYVELAAPSGMTTNKSFVLPGNYGAAGQVMTTDGLGNLSFASTSSLMTWPLLAPESADFTTSGYLFAESGNDTGFTSPSDGVIQQWGNGTMAMQLEYVGPTKINGANIIFPNAVGTAGQALTSNGTPDGQMSWASPATPTAARSAGWASRPSSILRL